MPKAGPYEFPIRDLDTCIGYLKLRTDTFQKLIEDHNEGKELSFTREEFGRLIGKSRKSGPFGAVVGSMNQYGLVLTGRGQIRLTKLMKSILFAESEEVKDAKKKAVLNIELFTQIFTKYGAQATNENIKAFLGEQTEDAQNKATEIGSVFRSVSHYFDSKENRTQEHVNEVKTEENLLSGFEEYRLGDGIKVILPKTDIRKAWKKARSAMDALLGTGE